MSESYALLPTRVDPDEAQPSFRGLRDLCRSRYPFSKSKKLHPPSHTHPNLRPWFPTHWDSFTKYNTGMNEYIHTHTHTHEQTRRRIYKLLWCCLFWGAGGRFSQKFRFGWPCLPFSSLSLSLSLCLHRGHLKKCHRPVI